MRLEDSDLERICEYADICPTSNYGNREDCEDKMNCKLYHKMVRTERLLWEYAQPEIYPTEDDDNALESNI